MGYGIKLDGNLYLLNQPYSTYEIRLCNETNNISFVILLQICHNFIFLLLTRDYILVSLHD